MWKNRIVFFMTVDTSCFKGKRHWITFKQLFDKLSGWSALVVTVRKVNRVQFNHIMEGIIAISIGYYNTVWYRKAIEWPFVSYILHWYNFNFKILNKYKLMY